MWWIVQNVTQMFYYSTLDFVFFIIVDAFAKFTIGDTNTKQANYVTTNICVCYMCNAFCESVEDILCYVLTFCITLS